MKKGFPADKYKGQFLLTEENREMPGWQVTQSGSWKLFTSGLPVINVYTHNDAFLGWCVGYPIINEQLIDDKLVLNTSVEEFIEDFYCKTSGRWSLLLISTAASAVYIDPFGSLSVVYSTVERTVASTPTLIGSDDEWDEELMKQVGFPDVNTYVPFGLTFKKNVQRIVPNHYLNISDWKIRRHWPLPSTNLTIDFDTKKICKLIAGDFKRTIKAISKVKNLELTLTAGRDSRILLACSRDVLTHCRFSTFVSDEISFEAEIASALAVKFQLDHHLLPTIPATPMELKDWLELTGYSVSGATWKIHKTIKLLDSNRVLLTGSAGEVGRSVLWKYRDKYNKKLTAEELFKRIRMVPIKRLVPEADRWLSEFSSFNVFTILDFAFIDQRLGCWGGPQAYGNTTSAFEIPPFNSRTFFQNAMRLPFAYRFQEKMTVDIVKDCWPELLTVPINRPLGVLPASKE
ncbi:MAG: hypothetical protein ICV66_06990, partial [Chitinophagaceae bacterium]|nr:hypothetical protein [Chitinophagaceae bacterium]